LNIQEIKDNLKTTYIGRNIIYFNEIGSTEEEAKRLAANHVQNGSAVIADMQTGGVGTHGRMWHTSANENILMTLVLYPDCNVNKLEGITVNIANCIADVIWNLYNIKLEIKHPNDLVLSNRKIGGILAETKIVEGNAENLFIGIGLNINQENFPEEIADIATSLKKEFGREFSREKIISEICNELESNCFNRFEYYNL